MTEMRLAKVVMWIDEEDNEVIAQGRIGSGIFVPDQSKEWIRHEKRDVSKGCTQEEGLTRMVMA